MLCTGRCRRTTAARSVMRPRRQTGLLNLAFAHACGQPKRFGHADIHVGRRSGAGAHRNAEARLHRIVVATVVVGVEEFLEPLQKLEVVLKAAADQFVDGYDLMRRSVARKNAGRSDGETFRDIA